MSSYIRNKKINDMAASPLSANTPWGRWEVLLDAFYCKVKRIIVNPGERLSYQKHFKREELWTVVLGEATVTLNGAVSRYKAGESVRIPKEAFHRVANEESSPLVFIEIQRGEYFGEDDIVRIEDDYGRADGGVKEKIVRENKKNV